MLDTLLEGMKGQVASTLAEKVGLDMGQAEQAVPAAGESIKEGIMGAVSDGDVAGVLGMFQGNDMQSSSIFQKIAGIFTGKLGALGIGGGSAVSALALPMILNKIKGAASGDSGQLDAAGIMNVLGGNSGGLMGAVTGALGGGAGAAGGVLGSVVGAVTGGAKDAADAGGGLLGNVMGAVTGGAKDAADAGGGVLGNVVDAVTGGAKDAADAGGGLLGNVVDAVTGGADEATEEDGGIVDDLKDKAIDAVKDKLGGIFGK